jgi:hypothetical protein
MWTTRPFLDSHLYWTVKNLSFKSISCATCPIEVGAGDCNNAVTRRIAANRHLRVIEEKIGPFGVLVVLRNEISPGA